MIVYHDVVEHICSSKSHFVLRLILLQKYNLFQSLKILQSPSMKIHKRIVPIVGER